MLIIFNKGEEEQIILPFKFVVAEQCKLKKSQVIFLMSREKIQEKNPH